MKTDAHILIVDDDQDILVASKLLLKRQFSQVTICNRPEQIPKLFSENDFDVILLDMNFGPGESSGEQGFYWLDKILNIKPDSIIVMITAHGGVDVAVEAMKLGATDFIAKPWQNEKVIATLSTAVQLKKSRTEAENLKVANQTLVQVTNQLNQVQAQEIISQSATMTNVQSLIARAAPTDANVLILGENGTGKELAANALHNQSKRCNNIFMSVDLGAIAESLFESELFGHKKGAFTGAHHDRVGKLQAANGGTLFLDELGNLPLHLQAKLLTVLEQRQVTPLGANKAVPFDVRVIAATNMKKTELTNESKFRQDLLFRLNTVEINLPPLRERSEDILPIAQHYLTLYCKKYGKASKGISKDAKNAILHDSWPGNIRALRHAIERAVILTEHDELTLSDFQLSSPEQSKKPNINNLPTKPDVNNQLSTISDDVSVSPVNEGELNLEAIEKHAISTALKKHRYNISHSAKELGLTRAALYRRMEKHGL
ncbi:sigma-54-dependent Fis family transcriptional regulator [Litorilituus lipolyticus]|uniref:Sigma-54-dependent Fis family transcriptional regulator n=2 Tax=Litorilituus lipolyticus TaxID=2491017 RepID=A0A502KLJ6_9GAMM|nr:sigma-54-dependent Fis family transcriptional regulator [Litorilituus lipolyticus]